jgi:hypothetical protein
VPKLKMKTHLGLAYTVALSLFAGQAVATPIFANTPVRTTNPNGFVSYAGFSAADDFTLAADAIVSVGKLWTYENIDSPATGLSYVFWADADASSLLPTEPAAQPLVLADGTVASGDADFRRSSAGGNVMIGGVEYAPYEYLFKLNEAVGLSAAKPYWLSFQLVGAAVGPAAHYLWSYTNNPADLVNAWGTSDIYAQAGVDWELRASSGVAFVLEGEDVSFPEAPVPPTALLMLPVVLAGAYLRVRPRRRAA